MHRSPNTEFACPGCGAYARTFKDGHSVCAYCGTSLPPLPYSYGMGKLGNNTPIQLGMKARIHGREFFAIGRVRFRETDDEGSTSYWEEWVLTDQQGSFEFLEYDEGNWTLTRPTSGPEDHFPNAGESVPINGRVAAVREVGIGTIDAVEGQIPWPIRIGESIPYADMTSGDQIYSAERSEGEIEWFVGERLSDSDVLQMFGLSKLADAAEKRETVRKDRAGFGCLWMLLSLVALTVWGVSGAQSGRIVATYSATAAQIPEEGYVVGPFPLTEVGRVHRLHLDTSGLTQTSLWTQAVIEDAEGPVFGADTEFWDESGYDDGAWHEWVTHSFQDFRLAKAGDYRIRIYADPETAAQNAPVTVRVGAGVLSPVPFAWFGFTGLVLGFCFMIAGSGATGRKVWEGMKSE